MLLSVLIVAKIFRVIHPLSAIRSTALKHRMITVVFHLNRPDSAILSKLTWLLAVLDSAVVKEHGGTDAADASSTDTAQAYLDTASAGSGMYIMTSYTPDSEIVLLRRTLTTGVSLQMLTNMSSRSSRMQYTDDDIIFR